MRHGTERAGQGCGRWRDGMGDGRCEKGRWEKRTNAYVSGVWGLGTRVGTARRNSLCSYSE